MNRIINFVRRSEVNKLEEKYRIIGYGAGKIGNDTVEFLNCKFDYFVDQNYYGDKTSPYWSSSIGVKSNEVLDNEVINEILIIICTERYIEAIDKVLEIIPGANFLISPLLKDFKALSNYKCASQSLIVAGYGADGGIYKINTKNGRYEILKKGSFRGMASKDDQIFAVNENGNLIEVYDGKNFCFKTIINCDENIWAHGLVYSKYHKSFFVVASKKDGIIQYDAETLDYKKFYSFKKRKGTASDYAHHLNDICVINDELFISMISYSGFWKNAIYDGVIGNLELFDNYFDVRILKSNLNFPHSITSVGNEIFYLESTTGTLKRGVGDDIAQFNGFVRGLTGNRKLIYIGQSRERRLKDALKYRAAVNLDAGIYIYDRDSQTYRFWRLPDMMDIYGIIDLEDLR
jgi:hypothetical protein